MKENPCISCGLCCIYYPSSNKHIKGTGLWGHVENDEINVPRTLYQITREIPKVHFYADKGVNKFIKRKADPIWRGFKRCIALEGIQGVDVKCTMYKNRPRVCSEFKVGGEKCNMIREWGGLSKIEKENP